MSWLLYFSAAPVALIMLLRALSVVLPARQAQQASFVAFSITAFLMLTICASYGVFASLFLRAIGYGGLSQWTVGRAFKWTMWLITGVTFRVDEVGGREEGGRKGGKEALETRPAVFVGNHQTFVSHIAPHTLVGAMDGLQKHSKADFCLVSSTFSCSAVYSPNTVP